uniref:Uncharacterized protein n=1 Tax=Hippocampus comes TaxID=109280 RepID=A0A3Q2XMJ8_HIPCM
QHRSMTSSHITTGAFSPPEEASARRSLVWVRVSHTRGDTVVLCVCRLTFPRGHFPRLAECAHFHYETADFGNVEVRAPLKNILKWQ